MYFLLNRFSSFRIGFVCSNAPNRSVPRYNAHYYFVCFGSSQYHLYRCRSYCTHTLLSHVLRRSLSRCFVLSSCAGVGVDPTAHIHYYLMCFGALCHGVVIGHALHSVPLLSQPTAHVIIPCASDHQLISTVQ